MELHIKPDVSIDNLIFKGYDIMNAKNEYKTGDRLRITGYII